MTLRTTLLGAFLLATPIVGGCAAATDGSTDSEDTSEWGQAVTESSNPSPSQCTRIYKHGRVVLSYSDNGADVPNTDGLGGMDHVAHAHRFPTIALKRGDVVTMDAQAVKLPNAPYDSRTLVTGLLQPTASDNTWEFAYTLADDSYQTRTNGFAESQYTGHWGGSRHSVKLNAFKVGKSQNYRLILEGSAPGVTFDYTLCIASATETPSWGN